MAGARPFWIDWCRLCARTRSDKHDDFEPLEALDKFSELLDRLCGTTLNVDQGLPNTLCTSCVLFVHELASFANQCEAINKMYSELVLLPEESIGAMYKLRRRYGLEPDDDDTKSIELLEDRSTDFEGAKWGHLEVKEESCASNDSDNRVPHESDVTLEEDNDFVQHSLDIDHEPKRKLKEEARLNQYRCFECGHTFNLVRDYNRHMKTDHCMLTAPFKCTKCSNQFQTLTQHRKHGPCKLSSDAVLYQCNQCDAQFTRSDELQAHLKAHQTIDRPFICEECGKPCATKGALKEHQITHSDERPYKCAHCPKAFKNMPRLKTHEDTHNNTNYICPHCGIQLNTKITLKMHLVVHSDQRNFKCQYCSKEYKRSKALKNHLILHTGLRPYSCPFCEKTFANGSNCRSHKKRSHPVELAALEAAGGSMQAANIPKLSNLRKSAMEQLSASTTTATDETIIEDDFQIDL